MMDTPAKYMVLTAEHLKLYRFKIVSESEIKLMNKYGLPVDLTILCLSSDMEKNYEYIRQGRRSNPKGVNAIITVSHSNKRNNDLGCIGLSCRIRKHFSVEYVLARCKRGNTVFETAIDQHQDAELVREYVMWSFMERVFLVREVGFWSGLDMDVVRCVVECFFDVIYRR